MKSILMLSKYTPRGASSRYRLHQYIPMFESLGHKVEYSPLLPDSYLDGLYGKGRSIKTVLWAYLKRIAKLLRFKRYDVVIVEQEILPYFPAWFEKLLLIGQKVVLDYDDAAYVKYSKGILKNKIRALVAWAGAVVVANQELFCYAERLNENVIQIPTVVDVGKYPVRKHEPNNFVKVVWIGTPHTAQRYLIPIIPQLVEARDSFDGYLRFRFIGSGPLMGIRGEVCEWSEETEAQLIADCDIGIMPLTDDEFSRGKSGLKLIQYMAAGLPVVASPVGENKKIVKDGVEGLLVTNDQFNYAITHLASYAHMRERLGAAGRKKVEQLYSLEAGFKKWSEVIWL